MYVSALDEVCSGICIDGLPRIGAWRREGGNYAESDGPLSPAVTASSAGRWPTN